MFSREIIISIPIESNGIYSYKLWLVVELSNSIQKFHTRRRDSINISLEEMNITSGTLSTHLIHVVNPCMCIPCTHIILCIQELDIMSYLHT
jgi:hypothetical protein